MAVRLVATLLFAAALAPSLAHAQPADATPEVPRAPQSGTVTIGASGDVLFHTRVVEVAQARGFDHLFEGLRARIGPDEIAFANLETPLSVDQEPMRGDPPRLGAPPEAARGLAHAGLDVVSVANNHAWDQLDAGMVTTLAALREAGITSVGAHASEASAPGPVFVDRGGLRVAFVAFTEIIQGHPGTRRPAVRVALFDDARARRALALARADADVVVASMHWGLGYRSDDRSEQRGRARRLVDLGADLVLGHGPHVLQRVERMRSPRGEALVVYSLGNLISNQGYRYRPGLRERGVEVPLREPATRDGVWLRVSLEAQAGRVAVRTVEAVPLWTENNWWDEEQRRATEPDIRVVPLSTVSDEAIRTERRRVIAETLGTEVSLVD